MTRICASRRTARAPHDVANHADIQTTMRYLHYAPRDEDAALVAEAFAVAQPAEGAAHSPQ